MMRTAVAVAAALLTMAAGTTTAATATPPGGTVPGLPVHLALGDSVAAGVGAGATPAERAANGYVGLLVDDLRAELDCSPAATTQAVDGCRALQLVDLSVGGATTSSLIATQLGPAAALLEQRNGDANPRNDVETVSVTIGGNDVFRPVIEACIPTAGPACQGTVVAVLGSVRAGLATILGSLRAAAGPDTEIAVMTYYNPLPACFLAPYSALADQVLEGGGGLPGGLNDVIRATAADTGADVAETYGLLGVADLVGGRDCLHPDASGHAKIAPVFTAALTG